LHRSTINPGLDKLITGEILKLQGIGCISSGPNVLKNIKG
jgi:hypothetical protein